jgi:hypothetical protein
MHRIFRQTSVVLLALAATSVVACGGSEADGVENEQDLSKGATKCIRTSEVGGADLTSITGCPDSFVCVEDPRGGSCTWDPPTPNKAQLAHCPGLCLDPAKAAACNPTTQVCGGGSECSLDPRAENTVNKFETGLCIKGQPKPMAHAGGAVGDGCTTTSDCAAGLVCLRDQPDHPTLALHSHCERR